MASAAPAFSSAHDPDVLYVSPVAEASTGDAHSTKGAARGHTSGSSHQPPATVVGPPSLDVVGAETRVFVRAGRLDDWWTCGRAKGTSVYAAIGDGQVLMGTIPRRLRAAEDVATNIRRTDRTSQMIWYKNHRHCTMIVRGMSDDVGIPVHKDHTLLARNKGGGDSVMRRLASVYGRRLRVVTSTSSLVGCRWRTLALLPLGLAKQVVATDPDGLYTGGKERPAPCNTSPSSPS